MDDLSLSGMYAPTQSLRGMKFRLWFRRYFWWIMAFLGATIWCTGFVLGTQWKAGALAPEAKRTIEASSSEHVSMAEIEARIRTRAREELFTAWRGVLVIEDGVAKTIYENRPGRGSHRGFSKIEDGEYRVVKYTLDHKPRDATLGIGLALHRDSDYLIFIWRKGKTNPPVDPGTLVVEKSDGSRTIAHR